MANNDAIRPVWQDRIYGEFRGSVMPQFDVNNPFLPLLNPVEQEGTFHNSGQMNNLFSFDNWLAFSDTEYRIERLTINSRRIVRTITEKNADAETGVKRLIARQVIELNNGLWTTTEELFDLNEFGQSVLVQKRVSGERQTARGVWEGEVV